MKPWCGRCRQCGHVRVLDHPPHGRLASHNGRRCGRLLTPEAPTTETCGGYLHRVKGDEHQAALAAYKIGGVDAVKEMFGYPSRKG